jgi:hypothetical protein
MNKPPEYYDLQEVAQFYAKLSNEISYPERPPKPERAHFKNNETYGKAMDDYELKELPRFRASLLEYRAKLGEIENEFKVEILRRIGISQHPRAEKLWSMAWERGHSSGFSEIVSIAYDLSELLS